MGGRGGESSVKSAAIRAIILEWSLAQTAVSVFTFFFFFLLCDPGWGGRGIRVGVGLFMYYFVFLKIRKNRFLSFFLNLIIFFQVGFQPF